VAFRLFGRLTNISGKVPVPVLDHSSASSLYRRIQEIRQSDLPLQWQASALLKLDEEAKDVRERLLIQEHADFIADVMFSRNAEGEALERAHQQAQAIELYEASVKDCFMGSYPYERLRVLYASSGRYADALRICQAYIEHGEDEDARKAQYREWITKYKGRV
jgi:tetratricopeptide (TPR) repeat protein